MPQVILRQFTLALATILDRLLTFYLYVVVIAALLSWVNPDPRNPIVRFLWAATEPMFRPFRRLVPPQKTGNIDLSPLFVLLILYLLTRFIERLALTAAYP